MAERVQKLIAASGRCSRRKAEDLISAGRVTVNGKRVSLGDCAAAADVILVDGKKLPSPKKIYIMLNKPKQTLTTLRDPKGRKTVIDVVGMHERIVPVGRLDYMTEGLLILTNDGEFANLLAHPRHGIEKEYHIRLDKPLSLEDRDKIRRGVDCGEFVSALARVRRIGLSGRLVSIRVHEGRNRLVRRIFAALGYKVFMLRRVRIGSLNLHDLDVGKWRVLTHSEIQALRKEVILLPKPATRLRE